MTEEKNGDSNTAKKYEDLSTSDNGRKYGHFKLVNRPSSKGNEANNVTIARLADSYISRERFIITPRGIKLLDETNEEFELRRKAIQDKNNKRREDREAHLRSLKQQRQYRDSLIKQFLQFTSGDVHPTGAKDNTARRLLGLSDSPSWFTDKE